MDEGRPPAPRGTDDDPFACYPSLASATWASSAWPSAAAPAAAHEPPPAQPAAAPGEPLPRPGDVPWRIGGVLAATFLGFLPFAFLNTTAMMLPPGEEPAGPPERAVGPLLFVGAVTLWLYVWQSGFAWMFSLHRYRLALRAWGFRRPRRDILWKVPLGLAVMLAVEVAYAEFTGGAGGGQNDLPHTGPGIVTLLLTACLMAPLFEEVVWRGFVFQGLIPALCAIYAAVASAAFFGLAHWDLPNFPPLFAAGLVLAWVYYSTRSLWGSITLHAAFNLVAALAFAVAS